MFVLEGVGKRFGDTVAVEPLDLAFEVGATTVLIGPSGCGKSTLLRLLLGLERPDSGRILVEGRPLDETHLPDLRRKIGYVIQDGGLFPHLSARGNAALAARHLGWSRDRIESRIAELLPLTRFPPDALDRTPGALSGGQRQRLGLLRALMLDPEVLLMDEPLAALDPLVRAEVQDDLREIFRRLGKTVVMVTHDLGEAEWFADRVVLMRAGRVVQAAPYDQLLSRPADPFVATFVHAQRRDLVVGDEP